MTAEPITFPEHQVSRLCESVTLAVMRIVPQAELDANAERAMSIIREEIKALIFGPGYADHRECLLRGTLSESVVLADVVMACVQKLREPAC